jgi:outer membrane protein insertion porin family
MIFRRLLIIILIFSGLNANAQLKLSQDNLTDPANPKDYSVGGIKVEGSNVLDPNALVLLSGLTVGKTITVPGDAIPKAIQNLWDQGLFSDISIEAEKIQGENIFLIIKITERPRLSRFKFEGLKKTEVDDVREEIKLYREKIVTDNLLVSTKNTITKLFVEKGFLNCTVDLLLEDDSLNSNHVVLTIKVDKNQKVKIQEIIIEGNEEFSKAKIKKSMKETKQKSVFKPLVDFDGMLLSSFKAFYKEGRKEGFTKIGEYFGENVSVRIFKTSKYLNSNFTADKATVIEKYNKKGFRDAKFEKDSVYKSGENEVSIYMKVKEGHQYYFGDINWVGNKKYASKILSNTLGIKKGEIYDPEKLDARLSMDPNSKDISSLYMDDGYLFFQVNPVETSVRNDTIDLEIQIYEGQQARINEITVGGNTKTNDHVVIRELRTYPGTLFSRSDIIRSQRELSVLGYFDAEQIAINPKPNQEDGTVDIEYDVVESPSDQIELSGGFGAGRIVGTLGVSFNNFSTRNFFKKGAWRPVPSGDGQRLSIRAQSNGFFFQSYNLSFTEPWLGGKKPNSFSLTAYYSAQSTARKFLQDSTGADGKRVLNPNRAYVNITGLSVGLGKRLKWPDDYFTIQYELSYQKYDLKDWNQFIFTTGVANNLFFRTTLSRSSIDQAIYPRMGSQFKVSGQTTFPYSWVNGKNYNNLEQQVINEAEAKDEILTNQEVFNRTQQERYRWVEYYKWKFTSSTFTTLAGNLVLNTKVGFGFLGQWNKSVGPAPIERFYLGGSGLTGFALDGREIIALRGYNDQSVSPFNGGTIISKYTAELRYPFTLNPSATIYGLVFAEAGDAWSSFNTYNPFDVKKSAGFGIRVFLPMFGLLGLDWGHRFDDIPGQPGMPKSQVHFTIGANLGDL